ncbi:MAG: hypothetical protein KA712_17670 [Myxococcales bacterium]|nr:hypothetical protein [Myxococcales bacterium]
MSTTRLPALAFSVGPASSATAEPARLVAAEVPGAVQLDWARAEGWPAYWKADNARAYAFMEDLFWVYRARLPEGTPGPGRVRVLVLEGVDYRCEVRIGGQTRAAQEGMFTRIEVDVTRDAGAWLEVRVWPAPKAPGAHRPRAEAARSCKPAVSYGWDWHPRLIPLGIWDEAYVEERCRVHLERVQLTYVLHEALTAAELRLATTLAEAPSPGTRLCWELRDPEGRIVLAEETEASSAFSLTGTVEAPRLWWPNGQGEAVLYTSEVTLRDAEGTTLDRRSRRMGFRRVRLVMNDGSWEEPRAFPKSRSAPPITLEVNGRRIFAKGSNWVNPEIFPGLITDAIYRPLIDLAKRSHFNILRVWGGGIVNKPAFFEQCDEAGLMVWQEFPLACNDYIDDPHYLAILDQESRSIIERLREHPSLCLWCGGNELFNVWSGMTDQHKALRLLNRNCFDLDPEIPFLPTSPVMGMGHGDYRFRDENGREVFQMFTEARHTAYTEFGCPGPSDADYIASFVPPEELFPPRPGTSWEHHHAFGAWSVAAESWLFPSLIQEYFGTCDTLEALVAWGQLMQAEGYKTLFEEARRQKPHASMALNWCFNEPWPSAANNSLVNWPARPKPALQAVAASCRPALASARIPQFSWIADDLFKAELWLLNDSPTPLPPGLMRCFLRHEGSLVPLLSWEFPEVPANQNLAGPVARALLPPLAVQTFELVLQVQGRPALDSVYSLCFRPHVKRDRVRVGFVNNA